MKTMKFVAIFAAILFLAPATAHAVMSVEAKQTCVLGVQGKGANVGLTTCDATGVIDITAAYKAIRVQPGRASGIISVYGDVVTIDNNTGNHIFVPVATPQEWSAFRSHLPAGIVVMPACAPDTFEVTETCGKTISTGIGQRINMGSGFKAVPATSRSVQFVCAPLGKTARWVVATYAGSCDDSKGGAALVSDASFDRNSTSVAVQQGYAIVRNFQ